jgi:hypothetical protein
MRTSRRGTVVAALAALMSARYRAAVVSYEFGGTLDHGLSVVRWALTRRRQHERRATWAGPVMQLFVLPVAGALALVVALSGPLFLFSAGAAAVGLLALIAPSAASFALARRGGRDPAAVMAWGTLCLQLTLTVGLSIFL